MRVMAVALVFSLVSFAAVAFCEWSGFPGHALTGADVLLRIHQYDLFQQAAAETAGQRGDAALRKLSTSESDAAEARDVRLAELSRQANLNVTFSEQASLPVDDRLAGLQGSVGASYVHAYYEDQFAEHRSAISLLQRYIAEPDNADVKAFAEKLAPELKVELAAARTAAEKFDSANK